MPVLTPRRQFTKQFSIMEGNQEDGTVTLIIRQDLLATILSLLRLIDPSDPLQPVIYAFGSSLRRVQRWLLGARQDVLEHNGQPVVEYLVYGDGSEREMVATRRDNGNGVIDVGDEIDNLD